MTKNIYGETEILPDSNITQDVDFTVSKMLEIDMDNVDLTLFKVIKQTQTLIDDLPENEYLGIYLVSGSNYSVNEFWDEYFSWVSSKGFKVKWFIRGKLHFENIGFMLTDNPVFILSGTSLMYDSTKLNQILKTLSRDRELINTFLSRYLDFYKNYFILQVDFNELSIIGLNFTLC